MINQTEGERYLPESPEAPTNFFTPKILKALCFACEAHDGVYRKHTQTPYVTHPIHVAFIVHRWGGCEDSIVAALLHDVVEDVEHITIETIKATFDPTIALLVSDLTDVSSRLTDGNRKRRKLIDAKHSSQAQTKAKLIKKADIMHNTILLGNENTGWSKTYLLEKWTQLHAIWTEETNFAFIEVKQQLLQEAELLEVVLPDLALPHKIEIPDL